MGLCGGLDVFHALFGGLFNLLYRSVCCRWCIVWAYGSVYTADVAYNHATAGEDCSVLEQITVFLSSQKQQLRVCESIQTVVFTSVN